MGSGDSMPSAGGIGKVDAAPVVAARLPKYYATIHPGPTRELPKAFARAVRELEETLKMQVWMLVQDGDSNYDDLGKEAKTGCYDS